jgi:hypothetical protein
MAINTSTKSHIDILEYSKYAEIVDDSRFPYLTATRQPPYGPPEISVFPKCAVLTYDISNSQTNGQPFGDNASTDGFGKLRVTSPRTLFDAKQLAGKLPQVFDEVISGTGASSVWQSGDSLTLMSTTSSGDYVIRQTSIHFNYQPGKSILAYFTGVFTPELNITKRIGLFQGQSTAPYLPTDGIFIESVDGPNGYIAFRVLKTAGTPYSLSAAQTEWNIDKLDGSGSSGETIDFNNAQLLVIDYEWLGVGRIRCGFNINGRTIYAHQFVHTNLKTPYITSGSQPVRYEIRQTGPGAGSLKHICSSVMSEGGEEHIGTSVTAELTDPAGIGIVTTGYRPIFAIRLDTAAHDLALVITKLHMLNIGNSDAIYKIVQNPIISGGSLTFTNLPTNPNIQVANGSATLSLSGGYDIAAGYSSKGNSAVASGQGSSDFLGELTIVGTRINGTSDVFVVAAKSIGGSSTVYTILDMTLRG